uniref:HORMA domain-containing protein n=1 Tax=Anopheles culicifacies TaxID=139723 RepID=A0A182LW05_9DIPT
MATAQDHCITLQGSAAIIHEYLHYCVHSIIFQRGIYPSGDFLPEDYNNVPLMVSRNKHIKSYIERVMKEVHGLIMKKLITKVTVCIITVEKSEIIERWDFNIKADYEVEKESISAKPLSKIQSEIRSVMRQIISMVSVLPCIEERCTFDIMLHTEDNVYDHNPTIGDDFREEDMKSIEIKNAQCIRLKQISTGFNTVDTNVMYRMDEG